MVQTIKLLLLCCFLSDCPPCYSLVQDQVHIVRSKINELREIIRNIGDNPQEVDDADFRRKLKAVNDSVHDLWREAMHAGGKYHLMFYCWLADYVSMLVFTSGDRDFFFY